MSRFNVRMDIEVEAPTEDLAGELVYTILEEAYRKNRIVNCEEVEINQIIEQGAEDNE